MRRCPSCEALFRPARPEQRFCTRNCGRWNGHSGIAERLSGRAPESLEESYLAGLIATDGYVERRRGRPHATGVSIKMAPSARPMLEALADHFDRRLCDRANGQVVLSLTRIPVVWKQEPRSGMLNDPELLRAYLRGLFDGDGSVSGARVNDRLYPYVSFCFNPLREAWSGRLWRDALDANAIRWRENPDKPTLHQIRSWSLHARSVLDLIYGGALDPRFAHPQKLSRARLVAAYGGVGCPADLFDATRRPYHVPAVTESFSVAG